MCRKYVAPGGEKVGLKFVDMFCGIGTIRMGFEQAGWECVYSIEWDKHKRRMYDAIFGKEPEGADIRTIRHDDIPSADCWTFGAPCQDFSIAGNREGLEGDRSSLVREVFRLVRETKEEYRPQWLLYENVKGMLSSNKGLDYLEILIEMESLGYDIEWQLLNTKYYGVPQNRERVFTLGHLRGRGGRKIFPIRGITESSDIKVIGTTAESTVREDGSIIMDKSTRAWVHDTSGIVGALGAMEYKQPKQIMVNGQVSSDKSQAGKIYNADGIFPTICAGTHGYANGLIQIGELDLEGYNDSSKRVYSSDGIGRTLMGGGGCANDKTGLYMVRAVLTPNRIKKRQNGRRFKEPGEPMFTLTKQDVHGVMITEATKKGYAKAYEGDSINLTMPNSKTRRGRVGRRIANTLDTSCNQGTLKQGRIRRLTPRECMRLQGVSDEVTDKLIAAKISDTQMYKGAGEACTVNVVYEIAKKLK